MKNTDSSDHRHADYIASLAKHCEQRFQSFSTLQKIEKKIHSSLNISSRIRLLNWIGYGMLAALLIFICSDPQGKDLVASIIAVGISYFCLKLLIRQFKEKAAAKARFACDTTSFDRTLPEQLQFFSQLAQATGVGAKHGEHFSALSTEVKIDTLNWLRTREHLIHQFLLAAAKALQKNTLDYLPLGQKLEFFTKQYATLSAYSCFYTSLLLGHSKHAAQMQLRATRLNHAPELTYEHVEDWIQTNAGREAFFLFLEQDAVAKCHYLGRKLDIRYEMLLFKHWPSIPSWPQHMAGLLPRLTQHNEECTLAVGQDENAFESTRILLNKLILVKEHKQLLTKHEYHKELSDLSLGINHYLGLKPAHISTASGHSSSIEVMLGRLLTTQLLMDVETAKTKLFELQLQEGGVNKNHQALYSALNST